MTVSRKSWNELESILFLQHLMEFGDFFFDCFLVIGYASCWSVSTDSQVRGANGLAVLRLWVDNAEVTGGT